MAEVLPQGDADVAISSELTDVGLRQPWRSDVEASG